MTRASVGSMLRSSRSLGLLISVAMPVMALKHGQTIAKSAVENATDFLMDAKMQVQQMDDLRKEVGELAPKIDAGKDEARFACAHIDICAYLWCCAGEAGTYATF